MHCTREPVRWSWRWWSNRMPFYHVFELEDTSTVYSNHAIFDSRPQFGFLGWKDRNDSSRLNERWLKERTKQARVRKKRRNKNRSASRMSRKTIVPHLRLIQCPIFQRSPHLVLPHRRIWYGGKENHVEMVSHFKDKQRNKILTKNTHSGKSTRYIR